MKTKIELSAEHFEDYREVWEITERDKRGAPKEGFVKGYCHINRPQQENEIYSLLPTKLLEGNKIVAELLQ